METTCTVEIHKDKSSNWYFLGITAHLPTVNKYLCELMSKKTAEEFSKLHGIPMPTE